MLGVTFYLKSNTMYVGCDVLVAVGKPRRISLMLDQNAKSMIIIPHDKRDFMSHNVLPGVYSGTSQMKIHSKKLCTLIARANGWNCDLSYMVPGYIMREGQAVRFNLIEAEIVSRS